MGEVVALPQARCVESQYVDVSDVATYLGLAESTVYDMAKRGALPHYRIGRRYKFALAEIGQFMAGCRGGPRI